MFRFRSSTFVGLVLILFLNFQACTASGGDIVMFKEEDSTLKWEQEQEILNEQLHIFLGDRQEVEALKSIEDGAPLQVQDCFGNLPTQKAAAAGLNTVLYVLVRLNAPFKISSISKVQDADLRSALQSDTPVRNIENIDWQNVYNDVWIKRFKVAQNIFFLNKPKALSDIVIGYDK